MRKQRRGRKGRRRERDQRMEFRSFFKKKLLRNKMKCKQPSPPPKDNKNPSVFKFFPPSLAGTHATKLQLVKQL